MNVQGSEEFYYIIVHQKTDSMLYLGHLDYINLWERLLRIADLPLAYNLKTQRNMKINFIQPLGLGVEGVHELIHITLEKNVPAHIISEKLQTICPRGIIIKKIVSTKYPAKWYNKHKYAIEYMVQFNNNKSLNKAIPMLEKIPEIIKYGCLNQTQLYLKVKNTADKQINMKELFSQLLKVDIIKMKRVRLLYTVKQPNA
ncbi:MAG: TIGR03936 family radical SAM-associated protein [Candidatus Margulisbacteria bacterium]|nr:TIGR03936 family radical SAM-associated protein [Candidatus Margulisiibacteriota bacterium]